MVKQRENGSYYTLPGGAVKLGETLEEGVIREVKEETGLYKRKRDLFYQRSLFRGKRSSCNFFNFLGEIIGGETYISRPKEIEEITWMDI